jgi:predicted RNA-binding protein with PIN domain
MAFLVDGNNVMGQTPGWHRDREGARRRLLREVAEFVAATKTRMTVVFDGAPDPSVPDGCVFRGIRVYYPGRGGDADGVIERLVNASKDRRGITVVTSDRRLAAECRASGATVMRSGEFRRVMAEAERSREVEEPDEPEAGSVEEWMRYFGLED